MASPTTAQREAIPVLRHVVALPGALAEQIEWIDGPNRHGVRRAGGPVEPRPAAAAEAAPCRRGGAVMAQRVGRGGEAERRRWLHLVIGEEEPAALSPALGALAGAGLREPTVRKQPNLGS